MDYLKGTYEACQAYNDAVYNACPSMRDDPNTTAYASIIERDGNYYIRKHSDYEPTDGLIEAELPETQDSKGIL